MMTGELPLRRRERGARRVAGRDRLDGAGVPARRAPRARGARTRSATPRLPDGHRRGAARAHGGDRRPGAADPAARPAARRTRTGVRVFAGVRPPRRALARDHRPRRPARACTTSTSRRSAPAGRPGSTRTPSRCSRSAPTAGTTPAAPSAAARSRPALADGATPSRPGRSRTSAATGSRPTCWCCRDGLYFGRLDAGRRPAGGRGCWPPASSTSTTCAAAPGWPPRSRPPRRRCAAHVDERRLDAVRFVSREVDGGPHRGRLRRGRRARTPSRVTVAPAAADLQQLTCRALRENPRHAPRGPRDPGS